MFSQARRPLPTLRVVIADDHRLMAAAVRRVLSQRDGIQVVGQAYDGADVLPLVLATRPDLVLLDIGMPGVDGIECAKRIRQHLPDVRILMLSAYGDPETVNAAERAGADGYVLKCVTPADFIDFLDVAPASNGFVVAGFPHPDDSIDVTDREREVLRAVDDGLTNREIGQRLWITEQTVKFHLRNLFRKLGASSRAEAVRRARELGFLWPGERRAGTS